MSHHYGLHTCEQMHGLWANIEHTNEWAPSLLCDVKKLFSVSLFFILIENIPNEHYEHHLPSLFCGKGAKFVLLIFNFINFKREVLNSGFYTNDNDF